MFEELDSFLIDLAKQADLWYRPNPGNAGDSLIASATWSRFRSLGIQVKEILSSDFDPTGKTILYGGGGNLNRRYVEASRFLRAYHSRASKVVLLPHSVEGHEDLLEAMGSNAVIFCRELVSLRHCQQHAKHAKVVLSHDLAIGHDPSPQPLPSTLDWTKLAILAGWNKVLDRKTEWLFPGILLRVRKFLRSHPAIGPGGSQVRPFPILNAFRCDVESAGAPLPEGNLDLSEILTIRSHHRVAHETAAALLIASLRGYRRIRTDRLHICIAAAKLGLEVEFHPAAGFKCVAILEHSLRQRFDNIQWMGEAVHS
ncbi:MAG TPA: polysaccharide pyruvyl transferase family protein [Fibrobacteria bacterium]|nr:polysaccharide pyruvyl transferase family protein [Fibrobacteria bacterium]